MSPDARRKVMPTNAEWQAAIAPFRAPIQREAVIQLLNTIVPYVLCRGLAYGLYTVAYWSSQQGIGWNNNQRKLVMMAGWRARVNPRANCRSDRSRFNRSMTFLIVPTKPVPSLGNAIHEIPSLQLDTKRRSAKC